MVVELMRTKDHLTQEGLQKFIHIIASMNKGLTETLKSSFTQYIPIDRPVIHSVSALEPLWVLGFCDGESNFDIRITQSKTHSIGYQVQLRFRVTQHNRDLSLLIDLVNFFNCGQIEQIDSRTTANYIFTNFNISIFFR